MNQHEEVKCFKRRFQPKKRDRLNPGEGSLATGSTEAMGGEILREVPEVPEVPDVPEVPASVSVPRDLI